MQNKDFDMATMPLRRGHFRVLAVASLGQVMGAGLSSLIGVVLPMIQLLMHPELSSVGQGLVGCSGLIGISVGSIVIGRLGDRYGYLLFFRLCPILILVASLLTFFFPNLYGLIIGLFLMGFGIGGGYSLDSDYVAEIMPERWKLFMVGVSKASSSLGNVFVLLLCLIVMLITQRPSIWHQLFLIMTFLSALTVVLRIRFVQSPSWLVAQGRPKEAEKALHALLGNDFEIDSFVQAPHTHDKNRRKVHHIFTKSNAKKIALTGLPWACEGFGVYGFSIFMPILILSLGLDPDYALPFEKITHSVKLSLFISMIVMLGFALGLIFINRWNPIRMQVSGFIFCSLGLLIILFQHYFKLSNAFAIIGFMAFELFLNAGPHLITFVLPQQVYAVKERGAGAGLAASFGKIGAILGVFLIPLMLSNWGIEAVMWVTIIVQLLGALVTGLLGNEVLQDVEQDAFENS